MQLFWLFLLALVASSSVAESSDLEGEGLCAYAAGRFHEAAAVLAQSLREPAGHGGGLPCSRRTYFLGRALQETGLQSLAADALSRTERCGDWGVLARREVASLGLEDGDPATPAGIEGESDPEVSYFAGLSAARRRDWAAAIEVLGRVPPSSDLFGHARFVRAQCHAASGDLDSSLADLGEVARVASESSPALHDRAELLRGKILYLKEQRGEAREAFAAVAPGSAAGIDALGGLLLTGGEDEAARIGISQSRPVESAGVLSAKAAAAEKREQVDAALGTRSQLREIVRRRLVGLDRFGADPGARAAMEGELAELSLRRQAARWLRRWRDERALAGSACSPRPPAAPSREPLARRDESFDLLWHESRVDPWFHGLTDLEARSEQLAFDLEAPAERASFWEVWRPSFDPRIRQALFVMRLAELRFATADLLAGFDVISDDERAGRRWAAGEAALDDLRALRFAGAREVPETLAAFLASIREAPAGSAHAADASGIVERVRDGNRALAAELSRHVQKAIDKVRRREIAFFERIEADNQGSLARLYARTGAR